MPRLDKVFSSIITDGQFYFKLLKITFIGTSYGTLFQPAKLQMVLNL